MSDEMRQRIRETAEAAGYLPSHAARALRIGRSANLGLVVPDFSMPLFPVFARAFEAAARRHGLALMVADAMGTDDGQAQAMRELVGRGVDALIVIPLRDTDASASRLPVPIITVDSEANAANTVASDHRDGGRQIARHLVDLGHRDIVILVSSGASTVSSERARGMEEVFSAAGARMRLVPVAPDFDSARDFGMTFDPRSATAIAAAYDAQAVGVISALRERGIDVPGEISVTGFDNLIWGRIISPTLTTVAQDLDSIAEHALAVATGTAHDTRIVPVKLRARASSGPCLSEQSNQDREKDQCSTQD
ncbi:HTH-type transcriptional regulator DegA [Roseivivax jejudonensis]|uniref:HTH-type transcriptional regulator DegA n=2 Tax=Roseivivax jejudonensis TaxID=1529041 RepID=A0A1X7A4U6_9RHOB|nr:HTH-type transcriptional regulator DegA [Roseivivax jejudonensis]